MPTPTKGPRLGGGPAHERLILANLATSPFYAVTVTVLFFELRDPKPARAPNTKLSLL